MPEFSAEKAAKHLITECNQKGKGWHSIYIQHRISPHGVHPVLMVHLRPGHESKWRNRDKHFDYPVEVHPWPADEL